MIEQSEADRSAPRDWMRHSLVKLSKAKSLDVIHRDRPGLLFRIARKDLNLLKFLAGNSFSKSDYFDLASA